MDSYIPDIGERKQTVKQHVNLIIAWELLCQLVSVISRLPGQERALPVRGFPAFLPLTSRPLRHGDIFTEAHMF